MTIKNFNLIIISNSKKGAKYMNKNLIWTKTILSVYRYLERICNAIDKIVLQSALASSDIVGQNFHKNNVFSISQKLIDYSQRKITLINLKVLIEECLQEMDIKQAGLLIEKYLDEKKIREIASDNNLSLRSTFRKLSCAENAFDAKLKSKGYSDFKMQDFLKDEKWILNTYHKIISDRMDDFALSNNFLAKAVSM